MAITIDLTGKTALVTGASRGIGRSIAELLGDAGAMVGVNFVRSREAADEVVEAIGADRAISIRADLASTAEVTEMFDAFIGRFGRIDILVNNAAIFEINHFERDDLEGWENGWRRTRSVSCPPSSWPT